MILKKLTKNLFKITTSVFQKSNVNLEKPIFIWGTGRNGSTLLMDLLSLNQNLCFTSIGKTKYRWKKGIWGELNYGKSYGEKYKKFNIPVEGMLENWSTAGLDHNFKNGIITRNDINNINLNRVKKNYSKLKMSFFFENNLKRRILDKAGYVMMVDLIDYVFPDSYHIFCIRDPRVVACSYFYLLKDYGYSRFGIDDYNFPGFDERKYYYSFFENIIWQVEQVFKYAMDYRDTLGDKRFIPVRYEDLVENPTEIISGIFQTCDLDYQNNYFTTIPQNFKKYNLNKSDTNEMFYLDKKLNNTQIGNLKKLEDLAMSLGYKKESFSETSEKFMIGKLKSYFNNNN